MMSNLNDNIQLIEDYGYSVCVIVDTFRDCRNNSVSDREAIITFMAELIVENMIKRS
jgi:hypothetical protein